ncbi:hypothetical protein PT974_00039 [Cladobotryum mycophilum]|uniref:Metallo-beta-lactamase domain-containing protein n=1 Tax=Cladobotryum mycophilum TaxID=491253 RepID=A0ABR0T0D1_9HYPO
MAELRAAVHVAAPLPEAVLVDTPITIPQTEELVQWIKTIAPGRKLSFIYITHGHGDHFFGIPVLLKYFPEAVPIATAGTVAHMKQQIEPGYFNPIWKSRFPDGLIYEPFTIARPIEEITGSSPTDFSIEGGEYSFHAIEVGQTDTYDSTALWVPQLSLVAAGDVAYGQVHQMLLETNDAAKRQQWIQAIEKIEALKPTYVIPGHAQAGEVHGNWHLANTKKYLQDFDELLKSGNTNITDLYSRFIAQYPDRFNPGVVQVGLSAALQALQAASSP